MLKNWSCNGYGLYAAFDTWTENKEAKTGWSDDLANCEAPKEKHFYHEHQSRHFGSWRKLKRYWPSVLRTDLQAEAPPTKELFYFEEDICRANASYAFYAPQSVVC